MKKKKSKNNKNILSTKNLLIFFVFVLVLILILNYFYGYYADNSEIENESFLGQLFSRPILPPGPPPPNPGRPAGSEEYRDPKCGGECEKCEYCYGPLTKVGGEKVYQCYTRDGASCKMGDDSNEYDSTCFEGSCDDCHSIGGCKINQICKVNRVKNSGDTEWTEYPVCINKRPNKPKRTR